MNKLKIDVAICAKNEERNIERSLRSVLCQSNVNKIFVLDDASEDRTWNIIQKFSFDKRVVCISEKSSIGLAAGLNKIIRISDADYIARHDADDLMMPNRIYWQKKLAINNPDCDILSGSAIFVRDNVTVKKAIELDDDEIKKRLRVYNPIIHPTVLFKRERIIDIGGYDSNFERGQDYELWVRAALLGLNFFRDKCIVTRYQYQKKSMRNKWAEVKSLIKIALKYRLPKIPFKNILPLIFN